MKVYIVRHGQSESNRDGVWTGWIDAPLTEKGIADAKRASELLSKCVFDKIYASDLIRARQTAENAIPGCVYETSSLLREVNVGIIAGKPLGIIDDAERALIAKEGYTKFGGESKEQFADRIKSFMSELEKMQKSGCESVCVFSHAGWLRTFLDIVVGIYLPRSTVLCGNCTVGIFDYSGEKWKMHSWINL